MSTTASDARNHFTWRWQYGLAAATLLGLFAYITLGGIAGVLKASHPAGGAAFGITDLPGLFTWRAHDKDQHLIQAVATWHAGSIPGFTSLLTLVWVNVLVDSLVFVVAYTVVNILVLARSRRQLRLLSRLPDSQQETAVFTGYRRILTIAILCALLLAMADILENVLTGLITSGLWNHVDLATPTGLKGSQPGWLTFAAYALMAASWAKWMLAILVVLPAVIALVALKRGYPGESRSFLMAFYALRGQIAILVILAVALLTPQSVDVLLGWRLGHAVWGIGLSFLLAFLLWYLGRNMISTAADDTPLKHLGHRWRLAIVLILANTALFIFWRSWGFLIPSALIVLSLVLSQPIRDFPRRDLPRLAGSDPAFKRARSPSDGSATGGGGPTFGQAAFPRVVAVAVPITIGLGLARARIGEALYSNPHGVWVLAVSVGVVLGAVVLYFVLKRPALAELKTMGRVAVGPAIAAVAMVGGILLWAFVNIAYFAMSDTLGVVAVLVIVMGVVAVLLWGAFYTAERVAPPAAVRALGFTRIPVLLIIVLWLLIATAIDQSGFHDVRTMTEPKGTVQPISLSAILSRWENTNGLSVGNASAPTKRGVPMIIVASSGGGIRAAYWTALAMDCLFEQDPTETTSGPVCDPSRHRESGFDLSDRVIVASTISGGSLGLAEYSAYLKLKSDAAAVTAGQPAVAPSFRNGEWVDRSLGRDFLSATLGWDLLVDSPRAFLRFQGGRDNAAILEQDWERSWRKDGADAMTTPLHELLGYPHVPLTVMNGTTVVEGCRFNASLLRASVPQENRDCLTLRGFDRPIDSTTTPLPASFDLVDFLCGDHDIRLSTDALLSARFPFVTPSGRLAACAGDKVAHRHVYVVDGGYFEGSGAETATDLWLGLQGGVDTFNGTPGDSCIVPFLVQLDNGYDDLVGAGKDSRPGELGVPGKTNTAARGARSVDARGAEALMFDGPYEVNGSVVKHGDATLDSRYARIYPRAHPGSEAPLGWSLSPTAQADLLDQLAGQNAGAVEKVRSWLTQPLTCAAP